MSHGEYALLLAGGWASLVAVDLRYRIGVLAQWRRLLPALLITVACGLVWDSLGVHRGYWRSDPRRVLGIWPLPGVPLEEFVLLGLMAFSAIVLWRLIPLVSAAQSNTSEQVDVAQQVTE